MSEWTKDSFWDGNDDSEDEQNDSEAIITRSVSPCSAFEISSLKVSDRNFSFFFSPTPKNQNLDISQVEETATFTETPLLEHETIRLFVSRIFG